MKYIINKKNWLSWENCLSTRKFKGAIDQETLSHDWWKRSNQLTKYEQTNTKKI